MSLGVDLVPSKVCSLNCIYCECGRTTELTLKRKEYISYIEVVKELKHYFSNNPAPDYITFSGAGEPTLNSRFGDVLKFIKSNYPDIPVAVLTIKLSRYPGCCPDQWNPFLSKTSQKRNSGCRPCAALIRCSLRSIFS